MMKIEKITIKIKDIANGYKNNGVEGVVAYDGKLDVRPSYQREFIYKDAERDAVIDTIKNNFPINIMYWADKEDGTYELLDGQQRTISFCEFINNKFSVMYDNSTDTKFYDNLTSDQKEIIDNYPIDIYICKGTDSEKLKWFERINIAGKALSPQELKDAIYHGTWVTDAKKYFVKDGCPCYKLYGKYMAKDRLRAEWLETAIKWAYEANNMNSIEDYMAKYQKKEDASELWQYFCEVMEWMKLLFLNNVSSASYENDMRGIEWGKLYNKYHRNNYNYKTIMEEANKLFRDPYVSNKSGIFEYCLSSHSIEDLRLLNIRVFDDKQKQIAYNSQKGICPDCKYQHIDKVYQLDEMEADHVTAWSKGGTTDIKNCQMLCIHHNRLKGNK